LDGCEHGKGRGGIFGRVVGKDEQKIQFCAGVGRGPSKGDSEKEQPEKGV